MVHKNKKIFCEICIDKNIQIPKIAECNHHKDGNHKNNKPENIQYLCTLHHAEIHNILPNKSELKFLIIVRDKEIKRKNLLLCQVKDFEKLEYITPDIWNAELDQLNKNIKSYGQEIKKAIESLKNNKELPIEFLLRIKGISYITVAKLISYINIEKTKSVSALWRYSGLDPTRIKRSKQISKEKAKEFGNPYLKKELLKIIADQFIIQKTPKYIDIYNIEKQKELQKGLTKLHAHNRAKRKMIKIFIKDLYNNWKSIQ